MTRLALVALSLLLFGCGPEDIVVAQVDVADGGSSDAADAPPSGTKCKLNGDCGPNEFCARPTCASPDGQCQLRPLICDVEPHPVCGCDRVTYWNDCVRQQRGANLASLGECQVGAKCRAASECPGPRPSCARIVPGDQSCPPDLEGSCWALPDACPPIGPGEPTFQECGGANACRLICDAIRSGLPHRAVPCMP